MKIRWLGCAAFEIEARGRTLLLDPFATRCGLARAVLGRLQPDHARIDRWIPRTDYIVCGHSHYDHALDAPAIAKRDGAILVGSRTTCLIARAEGVPPHQLREVPPDGARLELGPFRIALVPSSHGRWAFGRMLFAGCLDHQPQLPMRARGYVDGGVFGVRVEVEGMSIFHNGSAGIPHELPPSDLLLACLAGRGFTPDYLDSLVRGLRPRRVVASHFDDFFRPLGEPMRTLPGTGLDTFAREVRALGAAPLVPEHLQLISPP